MRRREFVTGIAVLTAWPLAAHGQQPRRVGVLIALEEEDPQTKSYLAAFLEALRALGWIEGQSLQIEHRATPDLDGLRSGAAELLRHAPDLMVTNTTPATNVVRQASANMRIVFISVHDPAGIDEVFAAMAQGLSGGVLVMPNTFMWAQRERIVAQAERHRVPTIYPDAQFVRAGGLLSYGVDIVDLFRRAASYTDRILKGANPGDLPVQQPIKFELEINKKTATALGLTVPSTLLVAADEVIE